MKEFFLLGVALLAVPSLASAQRVHRSSTTVHRSGTTVHRSTTTVKRTGHGHANYHRPVAGHPVYHPGNWNRAVVHGGVYHYPHGYSYHRWTVGRPLARVFLTPAYYYAGYAALGLMAPPPNYRWIRYGPDLMLVNLATGNVVDIRYGVFG